VSTPPDTRSVIDLEDELCGVASALEEEGFVTVDGEPFTYEAIFEDGRSVLLRLELYTPKKKRG
jgi:hypothetical protein